MILREEAPSDRDAIFAVNAHAFETDAEARLVDILRERNALTVSLVAEIGGVVAGHIAFSPVRVGNRTFVALAPMSVLPEHQRSGVGSALVRAGIDACGARGDGAIFVLGHAGYYPHFGFVPAGPKGLHYKSAEFDPHFFVLELRAGALDGVQGLVEFHPAFDEL
ncbi:MAG TPA: N-acetyltransferase [Thermoanaerobaculia bacterium]|nr:N-acetyltransferase [Thermoanaerobaculia bacterium]